MMDGVFALLVVVALIVLGAYLLRGTGRLRRDSGEWPFYAKKPLSVPEQVLYHRLVKSLPECIVLAQVQVSRVIGVKKGYNFHQWNNRINRLSLDYVVCKKDLTIIAAIELDDSSHEKPERREADERKAQALKSAGVPLLRWSVKDLPDESTIHAALAPTAQFDVASVANATTRIEPFIGTKSDGGRRFFAE